MERLGKSESDLCEAEFHFVTPEVNLKVASTMEIQSLRIAVHMEKRPLRIVHRAAERLSAGRPFEHGKSEQQHAAQSHFPAVGRVPFAKRVGSAAFASRTQ